MANETDPDKALERGVIPYIIVDGASDASDFYQKAFGARELARMASEDGKKLMHCRLEINGGLVMMSDTFPEHGHAFQPSNCFLMQLVLDDGQAWWDRAVAAGCEALTPFETMFWGDRYGQLKDPFQVIWAINEPAKAG